MHRAIYKAIYKVEILGKCIFKMDLKQCHYVDYATVLQ